MKRQETSARTRRGAPPPRFDVGLMAFRSLGPSGEKLARPLLLPGGASEVFGYNRATWMLDKGLQQNKQHQLQNIRIARQNAYRNDLRDLLLFSLGL